MKSRKINAKKHKSFALFKSFADDPALSVLKNPDQFMRELLALPEWYSLENAQQLDANDPLKYTADEFAVGALIPFAGHSLGPVFKPALTKILAISDLQQNLHEGHFKSAQPNDNSNWFDCDRHLPSITAAKAILGFADDCEFIFTASGLSQNLGMLMDTFYRPGKNDWATGKTRIVMLDTEFFSDQAEAVSVARRAIQTAQAFDCFAASKQPEPEDLILKIKSDAKGLFSTQSVIDCIRDNAKSLQMICLSDTVFGTGQRLELKKIFAALADIIPENEIIVGLDLAHSVGNRPIDLKSLPITFAVGCGYKHLSGFPGSGFGIYVNQHADLAKYPPLQGWKAADSKRVFPTINHYDASIMAHAGAVAFRASNPAPIALTSAQTFLTYFNDIGFDKCFNKSECLTRYMIAQLKHRLGDRLELVTPEDPAQRGAMIVFRIKDLIDVKHIEDYLKTEASSLGNFEIDVRPPNNIRLTAHYGYTKFADIQRLVDKLSLSLQCKPENNERRYVSFQS